MPWVYFIKVVFLKELQELKTLQNKDTENIINWKYYNIDEIQTISNLNYNDVLSLFSFIFNTCSVTKNIEVLEYLINKTKIYFDIIGIMNQELKIK